MADLFQNLALGFGVAFSPVIESPQPRWHLPQSSILSGFWLPEGFWVLLASSKENR